MVPFCSVVAEAVPFPLLLVAVFPNAFDESCPGGSVSFFPGFVPLSGADAAGVFVVDDDADADVLLGTFCSVVSESLSSSSSSCPNRVSIRRNISLTVSHDFRRLSGETFSLLMSLYSLLNNFRTSWAA